MSASLCRKGQSLYVLGYAARQFLNLCSSRWFDAGEDEAAPSSFEVGFDELASAVDQAAKSLESQHAVYLTELRESVDQAWAALLNHWNGPNHRDVVETLSFGDEDLLPDDWHRHNAILSCREFQQLENRLIDLASRLDEDLRIFFDAGRLVYDVAWQPLRSYTPIEYEQYAIPALRNTLVRLRELVNALKGIDVGMPGEGFDTARDRAFRLHPQIFKGLINAIGEEIQPLPGGTTIGSYTRPYSPSELKKIFKVSWDTLKRWFEAGNVRHQRLSTKSYRIHLEDFPSDWTDRQ